MSDLSDREIVTDATDDQPEPDSETTVVAVGGEDELDDEQLAERAKDIVTDDPEED